MGVIDKLEALFPGRGALAAGILRNSGILIDEEPVAVEPPTPEPESAIVEGGDVV